MRSKKANTLPSEVLARRDLSDFLLWVKATRKKISRSVSPEKWILIRRNKKEKLSNKELVGNGRSQIEVLTFSLISIKRCKREKAKVMNAGRRSITSSRYPKPYSFYKNMEFEIMQILIRKLLRVQQDSMNFRILSKRRKLA